MFKKTRFAFLIVVAALLLSACFPATTPDGATIDATQAAAMIETAVAQALNAQATQIAANAPTEPPPPTNTPIPAATPTLEPTITPVVLASPTTAAASSGSGGGTTVQTYDFACDPDIGKRPYDLTEFKAGDTFDIKFTILNTGTETWPTGYDLIFNGGVDLTNGGFTTVQLPSLAPGESHTVGPYDAWAPNTSGRQVMQFKLEGGFCFPYIAITVK
jgi:hypothetical protein